jgi:hypothetical protein
MNKVYLEVDDPRVERDTGANEMARVQGIYYLRNMIRGHNGALS